VSGRQAAQAKMPFSMPSLIAAARAFGGVAASPRSSGRKAPARAYDAMIAALAIANDLPVYACDPHDFDGIAGLDVVTVPTPAVR
jgi:tRNA(fMet)-specific endonuclease VapC